MDQERRRSTTIDRDRFVLVAVIAPTGPNFRVVVLAAIELAVPRFRVVQQADIARASDQIQATVLATEAGPGRRSAAM